MSINRRFQRERGLTMIELVMFIVIVSIAVVGVLQVLSLTSRFSADPLLRKQALAIAEGLIEEVELARFTYCHPSADNAETAASATACTPAPTLVASAANCPTGEWTGPIGKQCQTNEVIGPLAGETRPFYNVNDYASALGTPTSFTAGDATGLISDATGASHFPGSYTAKVTITSEAALGPAAMLIPVVAAPVNTADMNALHISVDVTYGNNEHIILDGYRTRYAPNSIP